jgi:adenylate kinase
MEEVFDMRKTATIAAVVVLAGLPGCGKTTWT